MTVAATRSTGSLSDGRGDWDAISWGPVRHAVRRLPVRIAKAVREPRHARVKALVRLLTKMQALYALALTTVAETIGAKTEEIIRTHRGEQTDAMIGKITQNKDFGAGYKYALILEDAKVAVEAK